MAAPLRHNVSRPRGVAPASSPDASSRARVCVGAIAGAHGIRGGVKIKTFTAEPMSIGAYGPVSDESGQRSFRLSHVRAPGGAAGDSVVIARLEGVDDRNAAEALRGVRLYVPRSVLPPAAPDEYYHHDLIGLVAVLVSGERLGIVRAVDNFGAGDLLDIAGDDGSSVVVPFSDAVVPVVDLAAGRLVIDPPEGLLDPVGEDEREQEERDGEHRS